MIPRELVYLQPTRGRALEAAIFAAIVNRRPNRSTALEIGKFVREHFEWATIREVYAKIDRMVEAGRIVTIRQGSRIFPLYGLPRPYDATNR